MYFAPISTPPTLAEYRIHNILRQCLFELFCFSTIFHQTIDPKKQNSIMARRSSESDGPESRRLLGNHGQLIESQDHVVDIANEAQPLLDTDLPMEFVPDKWFQRRVMTAASALLAIIIVSQAISVPALQEIMEDVICRDIYPDHPLKAFEIIDKRCKDPAVQNTLAMVKSWSASCELLVRTCFPRGYSFKYLVLTTYH